MKEKMERMNTAISSWHPVAYLLPRVNSFSTQGSVFPVRCNRIRTNIPSIRGQNRRMHKRNGCILQPGFVFRSETRLRLSRFLDKTNQIARYFEEAVPPHPSAIPFSSPCTDPCQMELSRSRTEKTFITAKLKHLSDQLHWSADYIFVSFPSPHSCFLPNLVTDSLLFPRAKVPFPLKIEVVEYSFLFIQIFWM